MLASAGGVDGLRREGYDCRQRSSRERVRGICRGNDCFVGEELGDEVLLNGLGECEGSDSRQVDMSEESGCGHLFSIMSGDSW